jgi:superfamily I DNA/RNA helicase
LGFLLREIVGRSLNFSSDFSCSSLNIDECPASIDQSCLILSDANNVRLSYPNGIREYHAAADERYESLITYRCPRSVVTVANSLLVQAEPGRLNLILAHDRAIEGEVTFVQRQSQEEEFAYVARAIADRLAGGTQASQILVLAPRTALAELFSAYAEAHRAELAIADGITFKAIQKSELTITEQTRMMLLGLVASPNSLLNLRMYLAYGDQNHYRDELPDLKARYGNLRQVIAAADPAHFPRSARRRALCERAAELRNFLNAHQDPNAVDDVLDELLPKDQEQTAQLRTILDELREDGDTIAGLLRRYIDYRRALPEEGNAVRLMTLMASKGLGAEHVFIIACNAGNMPGPNRNIHMTHQEHRLEQLRLLYVGFTRATQSLTVSWSRRIPFEQARGLNTPTVRTRRVGGEVVGEVGICEFLQNIPNINWNNR